MEYIEAVKNTNFSNHYIKICIEGILFADNN